MNILSLFNGHSGAYIAARDSNIKVDTFYASEIDKYANQAAKAINPSTVFLGDVRKVEVSELKKIEVLFGGSPCTDLSFAGKQSGLIHSDLNSYLDLRNEYLKTGNEQLYFHNDKFQQSILFWEYIRILKDLQKMNPYVYFFLENVRMDKKTEMLISEILGLHPVYINSNLVSAQNRYRLYWTNIKTAVVDLFGKIKTDIPQPKDRKVYLKDILQPESEVSEKYYIKNPKAGFNGMNTDKKSNTLRCGGKGSQTDKHNCDIICVSSRGRKQYGKWVQEIEQRTDNKANTLTSVQKDNLLLIQNDKYYTKNYKPTTDKANALLACSYKENRSNGMTIFEQNYRLRRLTPLEFARLQTVPDADFWKMKNAGISETQLYRMFGNGWTIEVIKHILSFLK